jgi:uncharacterized membrane protein YbhN (UPF0104 family)
MSAGTKKVLWRSLQVIVIGLIFYFLGRQLVEHWQQVTEYEWQINVYYLLAALVSVIFTFFVFSSVWRIIVLSLDKDVSYRKSFKIAYLANLGRYIPGKIWQMFGMIYLAKKEGVTEEEAVTSFGLSQIFAIPSGLLSGLVFLGLYPGVLDEYSKIPFLTTGVIIVAAAIFVVSLLVVFYPRLMESAFNRIIKIIKRQPIRLRMNKSLAAAIYGGYFLAWSLYGFSFWLFVKGITVQATALLPMAGIFIIAYQIGYLFLLAPGGVGPREAMMTMLLAPFFGPGVPAAIAIAARLWLIVAETVSALIALKIK